VPRRGAASERRATLLAAGLWLLREVPLESIDAPAVARRAGVSKALVYYYFPTHRDLQVAVVRAAADELLSALSGVPAGTPEQELTAAIDRGIDFIEGQPQAYQALNRAAAFSEELTEVFEYARRGVVDLLAAGLGLAAPTPAQHLCLRAWLALVEEAVLVWILSERPVPRPELVAWCRDVALHILSSPLASPVLAVGSTGS
jgi:AcrR family transcriptional regulator